MSFTVLSYVSLECALVRTLMLVRMSSVGFSHALMFRFHWSVASGPLLISPSPRVVISVQHL